MAEWKAAVRGKQGMSEKSCCAALMVGLLASFFLGHVEDSLFLFRSWRIFKKGKRKKQRAQSFTVH